MGAADEEDGGRDWFPPPPSPARPPTGHSTPWRDIAAVVLFLAAILLVAVVVNVRGNDTDDRRGDNGEQQGSSSWSPTTGDWLTTTTEERFQPVPTSMLPDPSEPVESAQVAGHRYYGEVRVTVYETGLVGDDPVTEEVRWTLGCDDGAWLTPFESASPDTDVILCGDQMMAFNAREGVRLWEREPEFDPDRSRVGPSAVALQHDALGIVVLDLLSGEELWRTPESTGANLAVTTDAVYYSNDDGVFALDLRSGTQRWRFPIGTSGLWATATAVYARTGFHQVHLLDPKTGASVAESTPDRDGLYFSEFVAGDDGVVVLRQANETSTVSVHDARTAQRLWQHTPEGPAGTAVTPEYVIILDGKADLLTLHDRVTGEVIQSFPGALQIAREDLGGLPPDSLDGLARAVAHNLG